MDEENQNEEQNQNKKNNPVGQFAKNQAVNAGKQAGKEIGKQGLKLLKEAAAKLAQAIASFIAAHIVPIAIIVGVVLFICVLIPAIDDFLDQESANTIDEVSYQTIKEYCTIDDEGIHFDKQSFLDNIIKNLQEAGIDLSDLGFGNQGTSVLDSFDTTSEAAKYLYEFMSASLAGEFPYIEGSDAETQGIVKIRRRTPVEQANNANAEEYTDRELKYIGYEKFQEMLKSDDDDVKAKITEYFSLDSDWNLCIAKTYNQAVDGSVTEYTISEVKIPYRDMVSQYTVPFMFLIDLQLITNNATYVEAVAELMTKQSEIVLTIFDNITTVTDTYTYEATRNTKTLEGEPASGWEIAAGLATGQYYETSSTDVSEETVTVTKTDTITANVTSANTWIIQQTTDYELQTTTQVEETSEDVSEEEPSGEGSWDNPATKKWKDETTKKEFVKSGNTKTKIYPSKFMGLWSNETGTYVKGAPYKAVGYGKSGKIVEYNLFSSSATDRPIINIVTSREQLYELLESSTKTQTHAEYMREFISIYMNGEELSDDITSLETFKSIFEPSEFTEVSYSYSGDFDVHDESLFITDVETLKKAFQGGYSSNSKLIANAQAFLDMQNQYKVNALFAAAVSVTETSAGTKGNAVNGCHNWFNITGTGGPYKTTTNSGGETHHWRIYANDAEGINAFGTLIANGSYYYKQGNYTVASIAQHYCPNTVAYPTQADSWTSNTIAQIKRFYTAAGMDTSSFISVNTSSITVVGSQDLKDLFPNGVPTTESEMAQYLTTVTIDINDANGNKTTRKLTVHKAVADDVVEIFKEIQQSGFKIKSVGAYSWRQAAASSSRSHHSYGVAIDINANENYMIKKGSIISGSFWKPGQNEYSITSNGAVVQAFAKRGWTWGGTWKSSKDYMHFSLTGH